MLPFHIVVGAWAELMTWVSHSHFLSNRQSLSCQQAMQSGSLCKMANT